MESENNIFKVLIKSERGKQIEVCFDCKKTHHTLNYISTKLYHDCLFKSYYSCMYIKNNLKSIFIYSKKFLSEAIEKSQSVD